MLQAITTRCLGATNTKGLRIKATSASGISVTIPYNHSITEESNHRRVAEELLDKLNWERREIIGGSLAHGDKVWVLIP